MMEFSVGVANFTAIDENQIPKSPPVKLRLISGVLNQNLGMLIPVVQSTIFFEFQLGQLETGRGPEVMVEERNHPLLRFRLSENQ